MIRCATLCTSLSRAGGGVFPIVRGLNRALADLDVRVTVLGTRDPWTDADRGDWGKAEVRAFPVRGPAAFAYAPGYAAALDATAADLAHVHGLWQYPAAACLRWARRERPYVVSPQGMLDPWALANARLKKAVAGWLFQKAHLRQAACLHACSPAEARAFRDLGLRAPVCVIPNGVPPWQPTAAPPPWRDGRAPERNVLLYLGRLHPKKGIAELIDAWAAAGAAARGWSLVIAGWDQGGHAAALAARAADRGARDSIRFTGPLFGEAKTAALQHAAAFVLTSHSEGMPVAILEAMAAGRPIVMTPACNIPIAFETAAAIAVEPDVSSIRTGLERLIALSAAERAAMGARGRALVEARFTWARIAEQTRAVYAWLLDRGPRPDCILPD